MADDIRSLTATLARDPTSLVYVDLADALRRRGQRDEALRVVLHGLARHPEHADGHDALARIYVDLGDLERARLAWDQTLQIAPDHAAALRGMGFVLFRQGQAAAAAAALERALALDPGDAAARRALETVRAAAPEVFVASVPPPPPSPVPPPGSAPPAPAPTAGPSPAGPGPGVPAAHRSPRERAAVFSGFDRATSDILLLDERGLVVAGGLADGGGADVSVIAAAALAGVSGEATRTADYLNLGEWRNIMAEAETANLVVAPVGAGALLLVRRDQSMAVGLALRFAERARGTALAWLEGQGA